MIRMIQIFCPGGHCLSVSFYDDAKGTPEQAFAETRRWAQAKQLFCPACGPAALEFRDFETSFESIQQAMHRTMQIKRQILAARRGGAVCVN